MMPRQGPESKALSLVPKDSLQLHWTGTVALSMSHSLHEQVMVLVVRQHMPSCQVDKARFLTRVHVL
jgi:hypothetical protein